MGAERCIRDGRSELRGRYDSTIRGAGGHVVQHYGRACMECSFQCMQTNLVMDLEGSPEELERLQYHTPWPVLAGDAAASLQELFLIHS